MYPLNPAVSLTVMAASTGMLTGFLWDMYQHRTNADNRHRGEHEIEPLQSAGRGRRHGSSSSGSSRVKELFNASSTSRRCSAISGVSYVLRTS